MNANKNPTGVNPWLVTIAVMLAAFMEVLDTSIANVALKYQTSVKAGFRSGDDRNLNACFCAQM
jgi:hypothetical protein